MATKSDKKLPHKPNNPKGWGWLNWVLVVVLVAAGVAGNYYYSAVDAPLRAAGWIVLGCVVVAVIAPTTQGRQIWAFAKSARMELRKVVWPTRQETIQTTLMVVAIVVLMALILWGIDTIMLWLVGWLTGQRG